MDLADYQDFADTLAQIGHFIDDVYRTKRIHSALGYLTPVEFEASWLQEHTQIQPGLTKTGVKCIQDLIWGPLQLPHMLR